MSGIYNLPVFHQNADSFGIIVHILSLFENKVLLKPLIGEGTAGQ